MKDKLSKRYERIIIQLEELFKKTEDKDAHIATICALLYHKFQKNFWVGFYFLKDGELTIKCYQGPLACQILAKDQGVCWASINCEKTIIVPDVDKYPGHIACDSRSKSEIVVPVFNNDGAVIGVLDIDSDKIDSYCETDKEFLEKIINII